MLSEEKIIHTVHLILNGLKRAGMAEYPREEEAVHEAKKICFAFFSHLNDVGERVRSRILSQKNAPPEHSPQWDTLYWKYYEEELRRKGS